MNKLSVTEMPIGWLTPLGGMYECEEYEHLNMAKQLVKDYLYDRDNLRSDYDEILLERGWVHITYSYVMRCYNIYWNDFLSSYQKNYLRPFMENKAISIGKTSRLCFEEEDGK